MAFNPSNMSITQASQQSPIHDVQYEMSPVTDLALNLSSLSTSMTGTPCRRISWSNPFPTDSKPSRLSGDLSPFTDSPMFQENVIKGIPRKTKKKIQLFKEVHSNPFQFKDEDKENCNPNFNTQNQDLFGPTKKSSTDTVFDSDSQDSGYSGGLSQGSNFEGNQFRRSGLTNVRSSLFGSDEMEDGFEDIFEIDNTLEDDLSMMPNTMASLLTKPLSSNDSNHNSLLVSDEIERTARKKTKMPIRRCLSMEMDYDSDNSNFVSPVKTSSKQGTKKPLTVCKDVEKSQDVELGSPSRFKRPNPPIDYFVHCKRRKSSPSVDIATDSAYITSFLFQRSYSETSATIMRAVQKSDLQPELIGDCSKSYALPLIKGKHQDLRSIAPDTLVNLIRGEYKNDVQSFTVVDCRYPYEFEAGHIQGAKNIFTREDVLEKFLCGCPSIENERNIIIFHCEFSSERAPNLCRFLRNKDREKNESKYPQLHQPEIYLLDGGYKEFFQQFKEYCEPQDYKPMAHKDHGSELRRFRAKSKSWGGDSRSRTNLRSSSRN